MRMEERNRDLEGDADEETDKKTKVFKAGFIISQKNVNEDRVLKEINHLLRKLETKNDKLVLKSVN